MKFLLVLFSLNLFAQGPVDAGKFFESIAGSYHIESVVNRADTAVVVLDPELPGTAIMVMPYCITEQCFDAGNTFRFSNTEVIRRENTYTIRLHTMHNVLLYEWSYSREGASFFKNFQFQGVNGKTGTLTHKLRKQ